MGAQTFQSLAKARAWLDDREVSDRFSLELFAAGQSLASTKSLMTALSDSSISLDIREALLEEVFGKFSPESREIISFLVFTKWSNSADLLLGLEELAIRAIANNSSAVGGIVEDLLAVSDFVHSNPDVELAVGSKRASSLSKMTLLSDLVGKSISAEAEEILRHLVCVPRGRRFGKMVQHAAETVANQKNLGLAVVTVPKPMSSEQREKIESLLFKRYSKKHHLIERLKADLIGGARIKVGNYVIDGSISSKLQDLRARLVG